MVIFGFGIENCAGGPAEFGCQADCAPGAGKMIDFGKNVDFTIGF